ncbi:MAG TPA: ThuA domain-containing protein [Chitinophagaceae bacterium]|jgi:cytochrome c|nr:ThuA domain-containing protein [Chitinophagaceae bacterium]
MYRKSIAPAIGLAALCLLFISFTRNPQPEAPRVLVFFKTLGWKHSSIPFGNAAIQKLGAEKGFAVDTTTNAALFTDEQLKKYSAVIFNNTTGNVLNGEQQAAFERFIQAGGGYVGIHAAADTEYDWPWYGKLAGAWFESHPNHPNVRKATIDVVDTNHPASSFLPARWERTDEWYNYKSVYTDLKVLATLDESTYEGGTNGATHPISWYHEFDGGRAFYTGCGHTDESFSEPLFLQHLAGGIRYAIGEGRPLDYGKSYSVVTPDQNRFVKTVLVTDLNTPMEVITAEDGRVFFTELSGKLSYYDTKTGKSGVVRQFPVTMAGGTGLIGVTVDPQFSRNGFMYVYYAPAGQVEEPILFNLSRFVVGRNNRIDSTTEKILLQVPVQKNSGSHHGGSFAWDRSGNLYLSTGDGTTPFPSNGYAPIDERPAKEHYSMDAQRSSANTNDLKGKILRIHPEPDGTYTIPEGNLFPKGMEKTCPEIYVMGCRNPYRIAVNPRTAAVYWGDIGPDAGTDSLRGPRGYDEFNQAKTPGNYGWPYFVGNNFAYAKWDFATRTAGPQFDPAAPENHSPNNTGLNRLPPARPAMIWYPYAASAEFPELGVGGRCAVVGDFYSYSKEGGSPYKFPAYYDGALFIADWMRNWVLSLKFDDQENYLRNEPFMPAQGDFRRPIDITFSKDGIMYMLEYGSVYGADNEDARLVKIEYFTGNRPPVARAGVVDSLMADSLGRLNFLTSDFRNLPPVKEWSGPAPLRLKVTARGSRDLDDDDAVTYRWTFHNKMPQSVSGSEATYTYTRPGIYKAVLQVTDKGGLKSSDTITVRVGNAPPKVTIHTPANRSFLDSTRPFTYQIRVTDREDKTIDPARVKAYYIYNPEPSQIDPEKNLKAALAMEEPVHPGRILMQNSDCQSCHKVNQKAVGPSFSAIAQRYRNSKGAEERLAAKIIKGGGGSWGTTHVMNAHPQLSTRDAQEIVRYILTVNDKKKGATAIPLKGTLPLTFKPQESRGQYTIVATYTDKGAPGAAALKGYDVITLRRPVVKAVQADAHPGFSRFGNSITPGGHKAYLLFRNIELTNLRRLLIDYGSRETEGTIEVRIGSRAGPVISSVDYKPTGGWNKRERLTAELKPVNGRYDVYIIALKKAKPFTGEIVRIEEVGFE